MNKRDSKEDLEHLRVIISGGGTGGHIFPAVAIANVIKQHDANAKILFVGAEGRMEMQKVPQAGYEIVGLKIAGFQRKKLWKNITLPFKMLSSSFKAKKILKDFAPDVVIGVGGYASWATLKQAQFLNIPTLLQEQNSLAGKSNQILAKQAKRICVAYSGMEKYFPKDKIVFTGNPVRKNISLLREKTAQLREAAVKDFGLNPEKRTVLVTGGSLGAGTVNKAVENNLQYFIDNDIQLLWQTGKFYYAGIKERTASLFASNPKAKEIIKINEFIFDMDKAYSISDVVIARAGALTVSELCLVGKPVILVPSPNVAEDHQTKNAMALVNKNAAIMIRDNELQDEFAGTLNSLINDKEKMKQLGENILQLGVGDADERIFKEIEKIIKK
ncbi:MAG: undecaprenyldiphospho-muramoylpentapeptide beta-N-acetylglucosaminyltransferase [Bacteroidales bacterium]|nr:undecaprenyldiphospho-muramoylpentapeptide beta-N-acetylglucosaminyltransferase [Bacteroidales bacterium]